jgi:hypothetical protein
MQIQQILIISSLPLTMNGLSYDIYIVGYDWEKINKIKILILTNNKVICLGIN